MPFGLNCKASKRYLAIEVKTLDRVEALVTIVATEDVDSMTIHYTTVTASCFVELRLFMGFPCTLLKVKYKNFGRESNLIDATNQIDHLIFVVNKGESRNALVKLRKFELFNSLKVEQVPVLSDVDRLTPRKSQYTILHLNNLLIPEVKTLVSYPSHLLRAVTVHHEDSVAKVVTPGIGKYFEAKLLF